MIPHWELYIFSVSQHQDTRCFPAAGSILHQALGCNHQRQISINDTLTALAASLLKFPAITLQGQSVSADTKAF